MDRSQNKAFYIYIQYGSIFTIFKFLKVTEFGSHMTSVCIANNLIPLSQDTITETGVVITCIVRTPFSDVAGLVG